MIKNKLVRVFLVVMQTIGAYICSIRILYNNIRIENILKPDIWLFLLVWIGSFFLLLHFFVPLKKLYNGLYSNRYKIAVGLFIILVLGKFNGSSYGMWDSVVEPNYPVSSLKPIMGQARGIRSDEWFVNSSHVLAQFYNDFNYWNDNLRANKTDMFTTLPVPVKSILIVTKPFLIGYMLFNQDYGMAIYWWGRLIVLFLTTFELLMIFTKKKKGISCMGSILICFSPAIFWWYSQYLVELIIGGNLSILFFNSLLNLKKKSAKVINAILLGWSFSIFFFTLYPAWLVPLGYFYFILAMAILIFNYNKDKSTIKNLLFLGISALFFGCLVALFFNNSWETYKVIKNTIYPGQRFSVGQTGFNLLFSYPASLLFAYFPLDNPCEAATFYSFFPLVVLLAIYVIIKERKQWQKNLLVILITGLICLFTLYTVIKVPKIVAKLTLLSNTPGERLSVIISLLCIFLIVLLWNKKITYKNKEKIILTSISIIIMIIVTIIAKNTLPNNYLKNNLKFIFVLAWAIIPLIGYFYRNKVTNIILILSILVICFGSTILVNPLMKGFRGVYDKPLAKELQKYQNKDDTWLVLDSMLLPNYFLLNGLKVINSTNVYPNFDFYYQIDKEQKDKDLYNRYAHLNIVLTNDKTIITSPYSDQVHISLNKDEVCNLGVKYIGSMTDISNLSDKKVKFEQTYHLDNIYLYQVNCN